MDDDTYTLQGQPRKIFFAAASVTLGAWAFKTVNEISGPAFEPILKVCSDSTIPADAFAAQTGYHAYEPRVGLGAFNVLVCLITQFLLELRQTYPAGLLTWGGVVIVSLPFVVLATLEAGRQGAKGPIRYPLIFGLLYQLFGISVVVPLLWVPSYIWGAGHGSVSRFRAVLAAPLNIPALIFSTLVFTADTDSYVWTFCAGVLGGPLLAMSAILLWADPMLSSPKSGSSNSINDNKDSHMDASSSRIAALAYRIVLPVAWIGYASLVWVAYHTYGVNLVALWRDVWTKAGPSVAFMTIDTIVLFLAILLYLGYRDTKAAFQTMAWTPFLGPGAACCLIMAEMEEKSSSLSAAEKQKQS